VRGGSPLRRNQVSKKAAPHRVLSVRDLSPSAFVLRFERGDLGFSAGQWVSVGLPGSLDMREYSIYSSPEDPFLEILVKEIPKGLLSPALRRLRPGDELRVEGPFGHFSFAQGSRGSSGFLFIATGTGISPFHCFARHRPGADYLLLHGVREGSELYEHGSFAGTRLVPCISGGAAQAQREAYAGRVTSYLAECELDTARYCYLCGNSDMIYEAYAILLGRGVPKTRIFAEVYF